MPHNVRGFTQGGEGLFLLLAWPLKTRLAKTKFLKLISITKADGPLLKAILA